MMLKIGATQAKLRLDNKNEHVVHIANVLSNEMRVCILTDKSVQIINISKESKN